MRILSAVTTFLAPAACATTYQAESPTVPPPQVGEFDPGSARVISIESLCTSMPTKTLLDFSMACTRTKAILSTHPDGGQHGGDERR